MEALRTHDERFVDLPDFPFAPHFHTVRGEPGAGLRIHFVDEGPRTSSGILMLHGEPSWSYLYRHMIRRCVEAGHRVVAPDLVGFGRSDKPVRRRDYTYARHVAWVRELVDHLDLRDVTLVGQDWGSLIGLRLATEAEDRFGRIVISNGFLPKGDGAPGLAFRVWRLLAQVSPWFPVSLIVQSGCFRRLGRGERRAYDAPFPSRRHKAGAREFPALVPTTPEDPAREANLAAWRVLERWEKPFVCCFSGGDPITRGLDRVFERKVPGAGDQPNTRLRGGHFVQEDAPDAFADVILDLLRREREESDGNRDSD